MIRAIFLTAAALAVGCTSTSPTGSVSEAPLTASASSPRVLAALQTRDRTVRFYGERGVLEVTVHDDLGRLVADRVPLDGVRAIDPFLYDLCTRAVARSGGAPEGTFLDARLYDGDVARSVAEEEKR